MAASSPRYLPDWVEWSATDAISRPIILGKILRKWQAARPRKMRRSRAESRHESPYLDDLIDAALPHLKALANVAVNDLPDAGPTEAEALRQLWTIFAKLPVNGLASCVGISKAVMLLTDGRIGPAFDSNVSRHALGRAKVKTSTEAGRPATYVGI